MSRQRGGQASPPRESILLTGAPKIAEAITSIPLYIRTPIHCITPHGSVSSLLTISPYDCTSSQKLPSKKYPSDPSAPIRILNPLGQYVLLSPIYPNQYTHLLPYIYTPLESYPLPLDSYAPLPLSLYIYIL